MPDAGATITTKVKAFAKDITKYLTATRLKKEAALKKAGKDPDKTLVKVSFEYSSATGSVSRSPQKQAEYVSNGTSWTCAGAHMVDKARHVKMLYGPVGKKPSTSWDLKGAFGSGDQHFVTLTELKTKWKALMKTHDLKNHKGGDGWGEGDAFHFELADSKVPKTDKRVQECLIHYAKLTRIDGKPKNDKFEKGSWKAALKPHLEKAEKEAAKKAEEERKKELKKWRTTGSAKGSDKLLSNASKTASASGKPWPAILPTEDVDAGKEKVRQITAGTAWVWDSLARSIFEKIGVTPTSGFDVKLTGGVSYEVVTFDNLSQSFIRNLVPTASVIYNTPVSRFCKMTVSASGDLSLSKSALVPKGTVTFQFLFTTPTDSEKGTITVAIEGEKAKASMK